MITNLTKLYLGQDLDLNYNTSYHSFTLISIIPLAVDAHREREYEEQVRVQAISTIVADHKKSKKYVPMLNLIYKSMHIFLKCRRYWCER